uniref:Uncharacterized protein n=1 Tax=Sinocyclocheilus grahami TaxID=75366 RepID=A0A672QUC3_SINGR
MRRKQKRLLQVALLLLLAFLLLPNVGLWSASLERMLDSSADAAGLSFVASLVLLADQSLYGSFEQSSQTDNKLTLNIIRVLWCNSAVEIKTHRHSIQNSSYSDKTSIKLVHFSYL